MYSTAKSKWSDRYRFISNMALLKICGSLKFITVILVCERNCETTIYWQILLSLTELTLRNSVLEKNGNTELKKIRLSIRFNRKKDKNELDSNN